MFTSTRFSLPAARPRTSALSAPPALAVPNTKTLSAKLAWFETRKAFAMDARIHADTRPARREWRWLPLAALLLAAGCKQGAPAGGAEPTPPPERASDEILPYLRLVGFARDNAREWVLLLLAEPGKPTEHLKLMTGQRQCGVEVRAINRGAKTAAVLVGDLETTLSMAEQGLSPEDEYAWRQRLSPDEHARNYNSPERQQLVEDHAQAQEQRQLEELAREREDRERFARPNTRRESTPQ